MYIQAVFIAMVFGVNIHDIETCKRCASLGKYRAEIGDRFVCFGSFISLSYLLFWLGDPEWMDTHSQRYRV